MKKPIRFLGMLVIVALAAFCGVVSADSFPEKTGYLLDSRGNVVKNSYGNCWRTGYWTPAMAIEECDPDLVIKKMPPAAGPSQPAAPVAPNETKPAAVVAPAAVEARFNAETLFDFDKAVIKPEGRKMLDEKIVAGMKMHPEVAMLMVIGHADRIGTEEYNQHLSERRANAVKAYLVQQGVAAERIKASGKGESEPDPVANTREACKDKRDNRLIACLQPDRRVTIEPQKSAPAR